MKKIFILLASFALLVYSCTNENKPSNGMNKDEQKAVENQVEKDQAAMDSLEKAIQEQINGTDTIE